MRFLVLCTEKSVTTITDCDIINLLMIRPDICIKPKKSNHCLRICSYNRFVFNFTNCYLKLPLICDYLLQESIVALRFSKEGLSVEYFFPERFAIEPTKLFLERIGAFVQSLFCPFAVSLHRRF